MVVTFKEENLMAFKHLFLKDYADGGMDSYAVYRQVDVYDHIDYIIKQVIKYCIFFFSLFISENASQFIFDHATHFPFVLL